MNKVLLQVTTDDVHAFVVANKRPNAAPATPQHALDRVCDLVAIKLSQPDTAAMIEAIYRSALECVREEGASL